MDGVLFYQMKDGSAIPHLFTSKDIDEMPDVREIPDSERYPLSDILSKLLMRFSSAKFGIVARGCDERAIIELEKHQQIDTSRVSLIGFACSPELAKICSCSKPYTESLADEMNEAQEISRGIESVERMSTPARLGFWLSNFSVCVKCMGCRNICPLCFCKECSLQDEDLVESGVLPPSIPTFHLLRAIDMAGRCVMCGLCEEACPAGIPLRTLYGKVSEIVREELGYVPGTRGVKSPLEELGSSVGSDDDLKS